jgi:hypothetical protein
MVATVAGSEEQQKGTRNIATDATMIIITVCLCFIEIAYHNSSVSSLLPYYDLSLANDYIRYFSQMNLKVTPCLFRILGKA